MEAGILVLGCLLSFLCGAWVRDPVLPVRRKRGRKGPRRGAGKVSGNESQAAREGREVPIGEQWENFWNYGGEEL